MTLPALRRSPRQLAIVVALGAFAAIAIPTLRNSSSARAAMPTVESVVIDGRGNGHGGGLSQWGALGWATVYGKSWQEILDIYYSGTTLANVAEKDFRSTPIGRMKVQLSGLDGQQTAVISETGSLYTSADPTNEHWHAMIAREVPGRTNVYELWGRQSVACPATTESLAPPDIVDDPDAPPTSEVTTTNISTTTTSEPPTTDAPSTSAAPSSASSFASPSVSRTASRAPISASVSASSTRWVRLATSVTGPIVFLVDQVDQPTAAAPRDVIGVCQSNRSVRYYRGTISAVTHPTTGRNYTFNSVLLEDYVRSVVPHETPTSWAKAGGGKGINALRAQAVAARSYALSTQPRSSGAKICDTSSCQVYGGTGRRKSIGAKYTAIENAAATAAVADTAGKVLRYANGDVAWTIFSSSNGGRSINNVYQAIDDPGDAISANPHHAWSRTVDASVIQKAWPQIGSLVNITVSKRTGGGVWDGWVDRMLIEGTKGNVSVTGDQFRRALKLKSRYLNFTLLRTPDKKAVGPGLFIGDSVAVDAHKELNALVGKAYAINLQSHRGLCLLPADSGPCQKNSVLSILDKTGTPAFAVVAAGYDDNVGMTDERIDAVMQAFLDRGVGTVLWLNLTDRRHNADGTSTFATANSVLEAADARWEQLTVLDWNGASVGDNVGRWFEKGTVEKPDLARLTTTGRTRFALFVRTQLDALRSQELLPSTVNTTPLTTVAPSTTINPAAPSTSAVTPTSLPGSPTTATSVDTAGATTTTTIRPALPLRTTHYGMRGSLVRQLQSRLKELGYPVKVDGAFGKTTRKYVRAFQRANKLKADGVVGRKTWAALGF